jgi:hypothetical protein
MKILLSLFFILFYILSSAQTYQFKQASIDGGDSFEDISPVLINIDHDEITILTPNNKRKIYHILNIEAKKIKLESGDKVFIKKYIIFNEDSNLELIITKMPDTYTFFCNMSNDEKDIIMLGRKIK